MNTSRDPSRHRQAILEAAQQEFHRTGFRAASLSSILASTGLTKGALYHHFPNKQALGYAVVEELLEKMVEEDWLVPLENCLDPVDCLKTQLEEAMARAGEEDLLLGCPINNLALEMSTEDEGFRLRIGRIYDRWLQVLAMALRRGQERNLIRPDIEPLPTATFIVGSLAGGRSLAKNAKSLEVMADCGRSLVAYLDSLRP